MADSTGISWCDASFNPWIGCAKVSPACARCYAETFSENRMGLHVWGADAPRRITAPSTWKKPYRWQRLALEGFLPDGTTNQDGHRPRVFCASMADVFEDRPDLEEPRQRLFEMIAATDALDWLILTKRPEFMRDWLSQMPIMGALPLPNVWVGASIENARFTYRADVLREIPAVVRFISAEPLLGSLYDVGRGGDRQASRGSDAPLASSDANAMYPPRRAPLDLTDIHWLIVGGESGGRKSRLMHPDWVRELRDDAVSRGIALHFKQWGSWAPAPIGRERHPVDGDPSLRWVCDAPRPSELMAYYGQGPKSSGKTLDGREFCEFPEARVLA